MAREYPTRLLAVDPSLTCSGWALLRVKDGGILGVGKIKSLPAQLPLAVRLADLQKKITRVMKGLGLGNHDAVICEAPTTMRDPRAAIKVEQVRSIFEAVARQRLVSVPGRINPRSVHNEVMGFRGRQPARAVVKNTAVRLVHSLYAMDLKQINFPVDMGALKRQQDIVDALLVGSLAVARVRSAKTAGISIEEMLEATMHRSLSGRVASRKAA